VIPPGGYFNKDNLINNKFSGFAIPQKLAFVNNTYVANSFTNAPPNRTSVTTWGDLPINSDGTISIIKWAQITNSNDVLSDLISITNNRVEPLKVSYINNNGSEVSVVLSANQVWIPPSIPSGKQMTLGNTGDTFSVTNDVEGENIIQSKIPKDYGFNRPEFVAPVPDMSPVIRL
jgi:hypothetical protein